MRKQLEARIVIGPLRNGRKEIWCAHPQSDQQVHPGMHATPGRDLENKVRQLRQLLESRGNYVTVVEQPELGR